MKGIYSPKGNYLIEVFNTSLFSDCYYCPKEDKIFENRLKEIKKEYFDKNFSSPRFEQIKQYALFKEALKKVKISDLEKLGYL